MSHRTQKDFNDEVKLIIDNAIDLTYGQQALKAIYDSLLEHHGITSDEIPYRLDTLFKTIEDALGSKNTLTLSRVIAKRVYARMELQFSEIQGYTLQDYMEQAKKQLTLP
jgi:hypothetical protein